MGGAYDPIVQKYMQLTTSRPQLPSSPLETTIKTSNSSTSSVRSTPRSRSSTSSALTGSRCCACIFCQEDANTMA